jgi:hypothetical protein
VPGLLFVLVGQDTAVGMVPFLPVDSLGAALPRPGDTWLFYAAPARGPVETVVTVAGLDISDDAVLRFNNSNSGRVFNVQTVNFPLIGDVVVAYGVSADYWDPEAGILEVRDDGDSNGLPFMVE